MEKTFEKCAIWQPMSWEIRLSHESGRTSSCSRFLIFFFLAHQQILDFFFLRNLLAQRFFFFFLVMSSPLWVLDYFEGTYLVLIISQDICFSIKVWIAWEKTRAILRNATSNYEMWLQIMKCDFKKALKLLWNLLSKKCAIKTRQQCNCVICTIM